MDRELATQRLARLHAAQTAFYAGGPEHDIRELLTDDVLWHVPGDNAIAGVYSGRHAVIEYFTRRRELAARSFRMHPSGVLVGDRGHVAVLTDGTALLGGRGHRWSTLGLYRFREHQVAACWLLPLDPQQFDEIWRSS